MTIDLSKIQFTSDFFSTPMPDGSLLVLNKVDESLLDSNGSVTDINHINIVILSSEGEENILCSSVIGIGNKYLMLSSGYKEYLGKTLNTDNMQYCTLELFENEN